MNPKKQKFVNYFGYGSNRDLAMMAAMVGRKKISGVPAKMLGHILCIQSSKDISGKVLKTAPFPSSPRAIVTKCFDKNFELYITKPKAHAVTYGTLWKLTPQEVELVRDWELLDFGMQEDMKVMVVDNKGKMMHAYTHGSLSSRLPINRIVEGDDYEDYLVPKKKILNVAVKSRQEYFDRLKKDKQKSSKDKKKYKKG